MRRIMLSAAAAAALVVGAGVPLAAHATTTATAGKADMAITKASVVGGVKSATNGTPLTFLFSAKNNGPSPVDPAIQVMTTTNLDETNATFGCVDNAGQGFWGDGSACEPGRPVPSGATIGSTVFTAVVNASTGKVSVRACVYDVGTGVTDPVSSNNCKTVTVPIVG